MRHFLTTGLVTGALVAIAACSSDRLNVPNYQNPTVGAITADPVAALPLLATGVLRDDRGNETGYVLGTGILGREVYNYTPNEGRNTSGWLTSDVNNSTSFGGTSLWSGPYFTLRDIYNTSTVLESASSTQFTDAQKNATRGFLHTMEAYSLLQLINTRDDLGIVVQINNDPNQLSPFVSRDSAFNYISAELDKAQTELIAAGSTAFPFSFHSGYAGFDKASTYLTFNRALAARVNAYRASLGVTGCAPARSATCYQTVLTNLSQSFIDSTKSFGLGVYNVYSPAANDVQNSVSNQATTAIVAHFRADSGIQLRADGSKDLRFANKVITLKAPKGPSTPLLGVSTNYDYSVYSVRTDPIPVVRNEELILLRAEAEYYTNNQAAALTDINEIRTRSGGLAPRGAFTSEADFLDELLYNRRLSLLFEGHRWIDMRRFGRLNLLTIDTNSSAYVGGGSPHVVISRLPIPQAECLQRASVAANMKAPGC
jgi:starch-binding outer membrane protein, SusD/RagB family